MENEKRIYEKVADIDGNSIQHLFDERAKNMNRGGIHPFC